MSHVDVDNDVTSTASWTMSTTFRMQEVRVGANVEIKITRTKQLNEKSVCALNSLICSCFTMVNSLILLFPFINEYSVFKMASIQVFALISLCVTTLIDRQHGLS